MANVLHPTFDFHPRPVAHAPSALTFGFGLNAPGTSAGLSPSWGSSTPGHTNPAAFQQLASSMAQASSSKSHKRKLDLEDDGEGGRHRDESMDRSPTETDDTRKYAGMKRARFVTLGESHSKDGTGHPKDTKIPQEEKDNHDIGFLLARLPPQAHIPIILGLLDMKPELKPLILTLIPRPSLQETIATLRQAAKKLEDSYPFTNTTFSFGQSFGSSQQPPMRDDYVLGRVRPAITEFVSTCLSYFPHFSYKYPAQVPSKRMPGPSHVQSAQNDRFQPAETFTFLCALSKLVIEQPQLVMLEFERLLLPRLEEEWETWVRNLDRHVNQEGNMVAPSISQSWEVDIERLAEGKGTGISNIMRRVHQHFPLKDGWGFASRTPSMMIES